MTTLAVVGAGGHGREAYAIATRPTQVWTDVVFCDDGAIDEPRLARLGSPAVHPIDAVGEVADEHLIAVGDPTSRRRIADAIGERARAAHLIADDVWVGPDVELAPGVMLYPGAAVTTNVRIGSHSHVNCGAIISHDCRIGAFVSISPGVHLNGDVMVDDGAFLGTGAIVLPGRRIGQGAVVGAGAVVTTDVAAGVTVVGVPAR